jgi:c(7)-type cytochrome triheme protein
MSPRSVLLAAASLAAFGCAGKLEKAQPVESPKYTFPHSTHVDAGIACLTCHGSIAQAKAIGPTVHVALPSGAEAKGCRDCHTDKFPAAPPPRQIERTITFSHADHLPKVKGECRRCHTALVEAGQTVAPVPSMSSCTACHNHAEEYAQAKCQPCHVDLKRYRLKPVADFKHAGDFLRTHGQMAKTNASTCAACHEQTSCAECHAATTRPFKPDIEWPEKVSAGFIHRGDYVSRHTIDVSADPASCRRCHGSAFCDACHHEQRISQRSAAAGGRNPHPPSFLAGNVHGLAARQNIVSCAGCHDQGARSTCVACHRNVNPHPPGWGARHNKTSDVSKNSMCRTCHQT